MNDEAGESRSVSSRSDFSALASELLSALDDKSGRDVTLVDVDFSAWPLDQASVVDALTRWIQLPGRCLHLMGSRFDLIERGQPRFAAWRTPFSHAVQCMSPTDLDASDMPAVLLLDAGYLELLDREYGRARWTTQRRDCILQRERIDALVSRCEPAWPVTVLGL